jgi:uncharacterized membrane protein YfcA
VIDPLVICFGLGVGVLIGLTGIGGGSLMTPLLILFAGVQPVVAIGTDLAYGAITKTVGGWRHLRSGTVDLGVSKWLAVGSVPGSIIGVLVVDALHDRYGDGFDSTLLTIVAVALFVVAFSVLGRALFGVPRERHSVPMAGRAKVGAAATGLALGVVLGMTSVGSGALVGLVLILFFRLTPHRVVGTDVFHAALMLWAAGLTHLLVGNVDLTLMANILIGSLPGVWLGTALLPRVPAAALRPTLGCVLLGSALGVVSKAGADIPTWTVVGVPALVGVAVFAVYRLRSRAPEVATA